MNPAAPGPADRVRLAVELVPKTCWFSNVRDHVDEKTWDRLRRQTYAKAGHRCQICGGRGPRWPVECHEVWHYDDQTQVQKLMSLIALCPACHEAKHMGLAEVNGRGEAARAHLAKVNRWTAQDTDLYLEGVWETWYARSRCDWTLDLTWLERLGVVVAPKR